MTDNIIHLQQFAKDLLHKKSSLSPEEYAQQLECIVNQFSHLPVVNTQNDSEKQKLQNQLHDSICRYLHITESIADYIIKAYVENGKVVKTNHGIACFVVTGYSEDEFNADNYLWFKMIHEDDRKWVVEQIAEILKGNEIKAFEHRIYHKSGQIRWVSNNPVLFKDKNEILYEYDAVISDITDRKQTERALRQSEERFAHAMDASNEGIFEWNSKSGFEYYSPKNYTMLGYEANEFEPIITNWQKLIHPDDLRILKTQFRNHLNNNTPNYEVKARFRSKDGTYKWIMERGKIIEKDLNRNIVRLIGVHTDIDENVKAQEELVNAKHCAEESDKLKSAFLANMSHEIRTPMNGIVGFAGLLAKSNVPAEKKAKYVEIIQSGSNQLLSIINDILDISKIEAGLLDIVVKPDNLNQTIDSICAQFEIEKKLKNKTSVKLRPVKDLDDEQSNLLFDRVRVNQIMTNLVGNALKFTENGYIEFGYKLYNKDFLLMYVKDTGIGIVSDKLSVVFERFRQADDSTTRKYGGTGLGLSICQGLVQLMGGKIWAESQPEQGSTFYFTIPFTPVITPENTYKTDQNSLPIYDWRKHKLLIVEDVDYNIELLSEMLAETGISIVTAYSGEQGINLCQKENDIDLILMDIQLPDFSGYEATSKIKKMNPDCFIIAQTSYGLVGDKEKALAAGCNDYISKPIAKENLLFLINKYLKK